jgi:hypothetical protein
MRRYEFDWLRVGTALTVFVFHCVLFFSKGDWHLKNPVQNGALDVLIGFLWTWIMPLMFLISGTASWFALEKRTIRRYLGDRVKRLLVPLFTVGLFVMLPPQFYFELVTHEQFSGTFWDSLPIFFSNLESGLREGPYLLLMNFHAHLWFLIFLFPMCLLTTPLLAYLKSESGATLIRTVAALCNRTGGLFVILLPLIAIKISLESLFTDSNSWADFCFYAVFFLLGYVLPADQRFTDRIRQDTWLFLLAGLVGFGGEGYFNLALDYGYPGYETFATWMYIPFQVIISVTQLGFTLFFVSLGMKYLRFTNRFLAYGNEAVLPVYILHQTIILLVAWYLRPWDIALFLKFLLLFAISFVVTIGCYEVCIKRIPGIRTLFGMRRHAAGQKNQQTVSYSTTKQAQV